MTTIRASFVLPAALHQRLLIASKQENKNLSEVVREILDRELAKREASRLDQTWVLITLNVSGKCIPDWPERKTFCSFPIFSMGWEEIPI